MRAARAACVRCGESLLLPAEPCGFCREERRRGAAATLAAAAKSASDASLAARADAIDTLRSLGYSPEQVLQARAKAIDGCSAEEILEVLVEEAAVA